MSQLTTNTVCCKTSGHRFPVGDMAALRRLYLLLRLTKRFGYLLRHVALVHESSTIAGVTVTSPVIFRILSAFSFRDFGGIITLLRCCAVSRSFRSAASVLLKAQFCSEHDLLQHITGDILSNVIFQMPSSRSVWEGLTFNPNDIEHATPQLPCLALTFYSLPSLFLSSQDLIPLESYFLTKVEPELCPLCAGPTPSSSRAQASGSAGNASALAALMMAAAAASGGDPMAALAAANLPATTQLPIEQQQALALSLFQSIVARQQERGGAGPVNLAQIAQLLAAGGRLGLGAQAQQADEGVDPVDAPHRRDHHAPTVRCYRCQGLGHVARLCPTKPKNRRRLRGLAGLDMLPPGGAAALMAMTPAQRMAYLMATAEGGNGSANGSLDVSGASGADASFEDEGASFGGPETLAAAWAATAATSDAPLEHSLMLNTSAQSLSFGGNTTTTSAPTSTMVTSSSSGSVGSGNSNGQPSPTAQQQSLSDMVMQEMAASRAGKTAPPTSLQLPPGALPQVPRPSSGFQQPPQGALPQVAQQQAQQPFGPSNSAPAAIASPSEADKMAALQKAIAQLGLSGAAGSGMYTAAPDQQQPQQQQAIPPAWPPQPPAGRWPPAPIAAANPLQHLTGTASAPMSMARGGYGMAPQQQPQLQQQPSYGAPSANPYGAPYAQRHMGGYAPMNGGYAGSGAPYGRPAMGRLPYGAAAGSYTGAAGNMPPPLGRGTMGAPPQAARPYGLGQFGPGSGQYGQYGSSGGQYGASGGQYGGGGSGHASPLGMSPSYGPMPLSSSPAGAPPRPPSEMSTPHAGPTLTIPSAGSSPQQQPQRPSGWPQASSPSFGAAPSPAQPPQQQPQWPQGRPAAYAPSGRYPPTVPSPTTASPQQSPVPAPISAGPAPQPSVVAMMAALQQQQQNGGLPFACPPGMPPQQFMMMCMMAMMQQQQQQQQLQQQQQQQQQSLPEADVQEATPQNLSYGYPPSFPGAPGTPLSDVPQAHPSVCNPLNPFADMFDKASNARTSLSPSPLAVPPGGRSTGSASGSSNGASLNGDLPASVVGTAPPLAAELDPLGGEHGSHTHRHHGHHAHHHHHHHVRDGDDTLAVVAGDSVSAGGPTTAPGAVGDAASGSRERAGSQSRAHRHRHHHHQASPTSPSLSPSPVRAAPQDAAVGTPLNLADELQLQQQPQAMAALTGPFGTPSIFEFSGANGGLGMGGPVVSSGRVSPQPAPAL